MKTGKWHCGWRGAWIYIRSVCGAKADCDTKDVDTLKLPRLKDRCKLCNSMAKAHSLFSTPGYFWFRRRED